MLIYFIIKGERKAQKKNKNKQMLLYFIIKWKKKSVEKE